MKKLSILFIINIYLFGFVYSQTNDLKNPQEYIRESHKLQNEGQKDKALAALTKGIEKFPNETTLYFQRAEIYRDLKKYDIMEADVNEGVRVAEKKYYVYVNAGVMLMGAKKCDKALIYLTDAINLDPANPMAFYNRASVHSFCFRDKAKALNDINYLLTIDPENNLAISFRNNLLSEIGNNKPNAETDDDLINSLEQKLQNAPEESRIRRELSYLYMRRAGQFENEKKIEEMFADFARAIEINPDSQIITRRGKKLCEYKYYEEAIKDFTEAIRQQPQSWLTYLYRGDAYHNLKQFPKALEDYNRALTIELASEKLINSRIKRTKLKMQSLDQQ